MTVEEHLRDALSAEADALDVDLLRLHAETWERSAPRSRARRGPALLVAACVLLVAGTAVTGALLTGLGPGRHADLVTDRPDRAHVDTSFTCADQRTWRFEDGRSVGDDGFVPDLTGGPAAMARSVGAPRYALDVDQDTATLRLGNTDGTLASRSDFARGPDGWLPVRALTCQGDGSPLVEGPGGDADRLAVRPGTPGAADDPPLRAGDVGPDARLLDRRGYHDVSGLLHDRTVWAAPCGRRLCLQAGVRDARVTTEVPPGIPPTDATTVFLPPDDMVGIAPPYALVVVHDRDAAVTWRDTAGTEQDAQQIDGTWFVLAPHDALAEVVVRPPGGEPRGWTLDEMR
jgi:hypothetical protein